MLSPADFFALCPSCHRPGESGTVTFNVRAAGQEKVVEYRCPTCDQSWVVVTGSEDVAARRLA
jgi:transposase-like protein